MDVLKTLFIKKDGTPDTFMIVICIAISISLLFAISHDILLWSSFIQKYHLTDAELEYMHKISFLYSVTIISELVTGGGYEISKRFFAEKSEDKEGLG